MTDTATEVRTVSADELVDLARDVLALPADELRSTILFLVGYAVSDRDELAAVRRGVGLV